MRKSWTDEELKILAENYQSKSIDELQAMLPGRTASAIKIKASNIKCTVSQWTDTELDILRRQYMTTTPEELQKLLPNRTNDAIRHKAAILGLIKTPKHSRKFHINGKIGNLTLKRAEKQQDNCNQARKYWTGQCSCGKIITLSEHLLMTGLVTACPDCMQNNLPDKSPTRPKGILNAKSYRNNPIGERNIYFDTALHKYLVRFTINHHKILLGKYDTVDQAKQVRDDFIEQLKPILQQYIYN